jgi:integrase/recombinase XerD
VTIKRAKTLDDKQFSALMSALDKGLHPERDQLMFALSYKCGLRAKEIAGLNWREVTNAKGKILKVGDLIHLPHNITKGSKADTKIVMHKLVRDCLKTLRNSHRSKHMMYASRNTADRMSTNSLTVYMHNVYSKLGFQGASSHSGRRTFGTKLARSCNKHGGSIIDVQRLMRHVDIRTTEIYIDPSDTQKNMALAL